MSNLTKHGNNADMQVKPLSDCMMRYLGFTDCVEHRWYLCKSIDKDITFNVSIEKDGSDWRIDILDENFLQPYDYQYFIESGNPPQFAYKVKAFVDAEMTKLVNVGIISNWKVGDYV